MTMVEKNIFKWASELGILEKAKNEGIEKGIEKGEYNKSIDTAKKMIKKGFSNDEISDLTGLSKEDIEKLFH